MPVPPSVPSQRRQADADALEIAGDRAEPGSDDEVGLADQMVVADRHGPVPPDPAIEEDRIVIDDVLAVGDHAEPRSGRIGIRHRPAHILQVSEERLTDGERPLDGRSRHRAPTLGGGRGDRTGPADGAADRTDIAPDVSDQADDFVWIADVVADGVRREVEHLAVETDRDPLPPRVGRPPGRR